MDDSLILDVRTMLTDVVIFIHSGNEHGVIDFLIEEDGFVIVDFKTDVSRSGKNCEALD